MNNFFNKFILLKDKFNSNKHLRLGVPFILAICIGPTFMQQFVEIQLLFGKVKNVDSLQDEMVRTQSERRSREDILKQGYKEMMESHRDVLEQWEPVRVHRSWEERDDTFTHYVTEDDLRLKD